MPLQCNQPLRWLRYRPVGASVINFYNIWQDLPAESRWRRLEAHICINMAHPAILALLPQRDGRGITGNPRVNMESSGYGVDRSEHIELPKEYREIVFSVDEVGEAMLDYATIQSPELSLGPPVSIRFVAGEGGGLAINFGDDDEMRFTPPEITAALIRHAKKIGVPVARKARKALVPSRNSITLKLWLPDPDPEGD